MELVYLWVEKYKNIKNQGFNFSPRFECEFDGENLTICDKKKKKCKNNEYLENFFGKNINITAIVGENGSGKSSVFEALYLMIEACKEKLFYVYTFDNNKFYYKTNSNFSVSSNNVSLEKKDINISYLGLSFIPNLQKKILNAKKKEKRISYTENYKMEFIYKFIDVFKGNNQILKKIDDKFIFDKLKIIIYRDTLISEEKLNIQNGLGNLSGSFSYETFLKNTHSKIEKLIQSNIKISITEPLNKRLLLSQMKNSSGDLTKDIKISFLINYMNNLISLFSNMDNINHNNFDSVKNIFNDLSFENLFEKIKEFEKKINISKNLSEIILKNIDFVEKWITFCDINKNLFIKERDNFCLTLELDNNLVEKILEFKDLFTISNEFNIFSLLEIELLSYDSQVDFFCLSSGEQKRLSLYIETIDSYLFSDSKILLLDEPDTFLHPQWSKIFINDLLKVLPKGKENKHLIFTSHSPFIISDLPKENVIFLEKYRENDKEVKNENQKVGNCKNVTKDIDMKTFGANIHTLLSNGFFISDGLMGEFAKSKITEILEFLNNEKKLKTIKKEQIKSIIESIGEDFLRNKLFDLYYKNKNFKIELKERKKQILDERIKKLKEERDKL